MFMDVRKSIGWGWIVGVWKQSMEGGYIKAGGMECKRVVYMTGLGLGFLWNLRVLCISGRFPLEQTGGSVSPLAPPM